MTKEGDEARSYNIMSNDNTNNNHNDDDNDDCIYTDDHNNIEDTNQKHKRQAWGTWEELLLACAVKRHGFSDWDSVATEVKSRTGFFTSGTVCRQKYRDLKRRFHESFAGEEETAAEEEEVIGGGKNNIPWIEQLRNLRVAELRREVQRYDDSILSLQLKVKKLEEERGGEQKLDLEDERKGERSEDNDGSESEHREKTVSAAEESDREENRSMNESNSTEHTGEDERPSQSRDDSGDNDPDPDLVCKAAEEGSEASHSGELDESETSGRKWRRKRRKQSCDGGGKNNHDGSNGGEDKSTASKSQPLISLLDLIRSHPRGSLFERRLRSQETEDYKRLVKQHLDIQTIQRNLKQGCYNNDDDDSSSVLFYRDLHLLFTNAIVFFPSSSSESMAAHELRAVVSDEMRKETGKACPKLIYRIKTGGETSDSSLSRQKSSGPLVVCKKRGLVSGKASPSSSTFSQREETKEDTLSEDRENAATGVRRSSSRASKGVGRGKNKQKQMESNKQETSKTEKATNPSDKKKSMADFLKRLKNSPQKEGKVQNKKSGNSKKESKTKPRELRSNNTGKKKAGVENTSAKRAPGRPQKKTVEAATATASKKRDRESRSSTGKESKQPNKRSRR